MSHVSGFCELDASTSALQAQAERITFWIIGLGHLALASYATPSPGGRVLLPGDIIFKCKPEPDQDDRWWSQSSSLQNGEK